MKVPCAFVMAALSLLSCAGERSIQRGIILKDISSISDRSLSRLMNMRIFLGHQSVGFNLLDGIDATLKGRGLEGFHFKETRQPDDGSDPLFFHATIGENGDPIGKVNDFDAIIRGGMGATVDLAFMKFCYFDIDAGTDVEALFSAYEAAISRLRADFPDLIIAYMTVPLTSLDRGPKAAAKKLLGRPVRGYSDNVAREKFNRLLRDRCPPGVPLIDLALFESVSATGERSALSADGITFYALRDEYTDDGGHLSPNGRRIVGERLLASLAECAQLAR